MTDAERHDGEQQSTQPRPEGGPAPDEPRADVPVEDAAHDDAPAVADGPTEDQAAPRTAPVDAPRTSSAAPEGDDAQPQEPEHAALSEEDDPRSREELLAELREAEARRDEYLDDLRRARAEFENFRRRTMREGASQRDLGKADVLTGMLEVLDDLDRTLEAAEDSEDASLAKGIGLVAGKLVQSLQAQGLERIDATGVAFDPNEHEAVQQVEGDGTNEEPTVAQVLRPGYRTGDRVLRAAMVVVEQ